MAGGEEEGAAGSSSAPPLPEPSEESVSRLVEMGFVPGAAVQALQVTHGTVDAAIGLLVG